MSLMRRLEIDVAAVLGTTGVTILVMGLAQLLPVLVALWVGAPAIPLLLGALATIAAGGGLLPMRRQATRKATRRDSLAIVSVSWLAAIGAGAVPFVVAGACGLVDALFESASGLTTTGASIFVDVERLTTFAPVTAALEPDPNDAPLHLWRALTHWLGGAGIVLVVLVLTPFLNDVEALRRTQRSEASLLTERYRGSTRATTNGLLTVYVGATLLQAVLLVLAGLSLWDALIHSFSTIATGGFSNRTASLGAWGPTVQLITVTFMVIGALNFAVLGRAAEEVRVTWRRGRHALGPLRGTGVALRLGPWIFLRTVWRSGEARGYIGLLAVSTLLVAGMLMGWGSPARYAEQGLMGAWRAFVDGAFNVVSVSSTTGFVTEDYLRWPAGCQIVFLVLMMIGGCAGSTAGGVKLRRIMIVAKYAYRETRRFALPRAVIPIKLGDAVVSDEQVREALGFTTTYVLVLVVAALLLSLTGEDVMTSGSAAVSALGSVGPGFAEVGPMGNYQGLNHAAKLIVMLTMLVGRLEIFPLVTTLMPSFWFRRGGHAPVG